MNIEAQNNSDLKDKYNFYIKPLNNKEPTSNVLGYYVESTANYDVEDPGKSTSPNKIEIKRLAAEIFEQKDPQLVIYIHGYSVRPDRAKNRSQEIYEFAASNSKSENSIFIGYRWPAENRREKEDFPFVDRDKLKQAFTSLPTLLLALLITAIVVGLTSLSLTFLSLFTKEIFNNDWYFYALCTATFILSIALSLGLRCLGKANNNLRFFPHLLILAIFATSISVVFGLIPKELNFNWSLGFILIFLVISIVVLSIVLALMA